MLKIKSQNISLLTYVILFFCLISLSTDLLLTNKIFWGTLFILSFVFSKIHFKFKSIVVGIFALGALKGAVWLTKRSAGLYSMGDIYSS